MNNKKIIEGILFKKFFSLFVISILIVSLVGFSMVSAAGNVQKETVSTGAKVSLNQEISALFKEMQSKLNAGEIISSDFKKQFVDKIENLLRERGYTNFIRESPSRIIFTPEGTNPLSLAAQKINEISFGNDIRGTIALDLDLVRAGEAAQGAFAEGSTLYLNPKIFSADKRGFEKAIPLIVDHEAVHLSENTAILRGLDTTNSMGRYPKSPVAGYEFIRADELNAYSTNLQNNFDNLLKDSEEVASRLNGEVLNLPDKKSLLSQIENSLKKLKTGGTNGDDLFKLKAMSDFYFSSSLQNLRELNGLIENGATLQVELQDLVLEAGGISQKTIVVTAENLEGPLIFTISEEGGNRYLKSIFINEAGVRTEYVITQQAAGDLFGKIDSALRTGDIADLSEDILGIVRNQIISQETNVNNLAKQKKALTQLIGDYIGDVEVNGAIGAGDAQRFKDILTQKLNNLGPFIERNAGSADSLTSLSVLPETLPDVLGVQGINPIDINLLNPSTPLPEVPRPSPDVNANLVPEGTKLSGVETKPVSQEMANALEDAKAAANAAKAAGKAEVTAAKLLKGEIKGNVKMGLVIAGAIVLFTEGMTFANDLGEGRGIVDSAITAGEAGQEAGIGAVSEMAPYFVPVLAEVKTFNEAEGVAEGVVETAISSAGSLGMSIPIIAAAIGGKAAVAAVTTLSAGLGLGGLVGGGTYYLSSKASKAFIVPEIEEAFVRQLDEENSAAVKWTRGVYIEQQVNLYESGQITLEELMQDFVDKRIVSGPLAESIYDNVQGLENKADEIFFNLNRINQLSDEDKQLLADYSELINEGEDIIQGLERIKQMSESEREGLIGNAEGADTDKLTDLARESYEEQGLAAKFEQLNPAAGSDFKIPEAFGNNNIQIQLEDNPGEFPNLERGVPRNSPDTLPELNPNEQIQLPENSKIRDLSSEVQTTNNPPATPTPPPSRPQCLKGNIRASDGQCYACNLISGYKLNSNGDCVIDTMTRSCSLGMIKANDGECVNADCSSNNGKSYLMIGPDQCILNSESDTSEGSSGDSSGESSGSSRNLCTFGAGGESSIMGSFAGRGIISDYCKLQTKNDAKERCASYYRIPLNSVSCTLRSGTYSFYNLPAGDKACAATYSCTYS